MVIIVVGIVTGVLSIDITSDKNQRLYIGNSTISKRVFLMSWIRFILMLELERLSVHQCLALCSWSSVMSKFGRFH